jgi:putative aminopeptidase FrvX
MDFLKRLSEAPGIPGHETKIRAIVREALAEHVDEVETDHLGNVIAHKRGPAPLVAVAAHMDEIGFIVSHIEKESGFLRMQPYGGFDPKTLIAQRVVVHTENGDLIGCIGSKPIHILTEEERKKPPDLKELFVDVGLPEEEVRKRVSIGDPMTLRQDFLMHEQTVSGKALDDRLGIYVGIEAVKRVKDLTCDLYFVGTTQEEVGLRGARVAGFAINPEIGIALDVTVAADMPGVPGAQQVTQLGKGVAIKLSDSMSISHPALVKAMRKLAEEREIPYQMEVLPRGGTDAGAFQMAQEGAAVITLSIPTRYVHSVVEMAHQEDLKAAIDLLTAFLETAGEVDLTL